MNLPLNSPAHALWRLLYAQRALERQQWQGAVKAVLMQQALETIAADLTAGRITVDQAITRAQRDAMRIGTMYLLLGFPLEERMN